MITLPPRPWLVAGALSVAATAVGVLWLLRPEAYPYGQHATVRTGLNALLPASAGAVALLVLGALGIALLLWKWAGGRAAIGAALLAAGFAIVLGDTSLFSSLGYFVGLLLPFVALTLLVVLTKARPRTGAPVLLLAVVGTVALWASGQLSSLLALYGTYVTNTIGSLGHYLSPIAWSWAMAATAACWCWAAVAELREALRQRAAWTRPPQLVRWARPVTIVAALGAAPYGLLRLTWLTPWPMGGGNAEIFVDELDATTRITGALFVLPCAASVLLVLGLICEWGRVFPSWLPVVGGARVPVRLVTTVGAVVAAAITMSAPGMLLMPFIHGDGLATALLWQLVFPFYLWGPALAAAVLGYWLRSTNVDGVAPAVSTPPGPRPAARPADALATGHTAGTTDDALER